MAPKDKDQVTEILVNFTSDALSELKETNKKINSVDKTTAEIKVVVDSLAECSEKHDEFIFGNGKEGAKTEISNLKKANEALNEKMTEVKEDNKNTKNLVKLLLKTFWGLIIVIIAALITLLTT